MQNYLGQDVEIELLKDLVMHLEQRFFVDIGAEKGSVASVLFESGMSGVLFEPMERHKAALTELVKCHSGKYYPWAISDFDGDSDFHIATNESGDELDYFHSLKRVEADKQFEHSKKMRVSCRTLESLVAENVLPEKIGVLKTDTEGNDLFVLKGMGALKPELVVCEFFTDGVYDGWQDAHPELVIELMRSKGYAHYISVKHSGVSKYCTVSPSAFLEKQWGNLFFLSDELFQKSSSVIAKYLHRSEQGMMEEINQLKQDSIEKEKVIQGLVGKGESLSSPQQTKPEIAGASVNQKSKHANCVTLMQTIINIFDNNSEKQGLVAIDVGAHHGHFSSDLLNSGQFKNVVAFEPNNETISKIDIDNAAFTVVNAAVGSKKGTLDYYCDENTATGSLLNYAKNYDAYGTVKHFSVPVVTLDDYCLKETHLQEKISLIKVDTQGYDLEVLKGAERIIEGDKPLIVAELIFIPLYENQANPFEIISYLQNKGYELYSIAQVHTSAEGKLAFLDALFVPKTIYVPQSQAFMQLDNQESLSKQVKLFETICQERLDVINVLDAEVQRLKRLNS